MCIYILSTIWWWFRECSCGDSYNITRKIAACLPHCVVGEMNEASFPWHMMLSFCRHRLASLDPHQIGAPSQKWLPTNHTVSVLGGIYLSTLFPDLTWWCCWLPSSHLNLVVHLSLRNMILTWKPGWVKAEFSLLCSSSHSHLLMWSLGERFGLFFYCSVSNQQWSTSQLLVLFLMDAMEREESLANKWPASKLSLGHDLLLTHALLHCYHPH